jgi:transcriptional regulator with XRE-family HTH domain
MERSADRLAKRLKELRGDTSQLQFCKKLGVSKSSLHRMEMGEQNVTLDTLDALCARLKFDICDLFPPPGKAKGKTP